MDAAHTYFNKTVLFLATALLTVVSGYAQTPSFNLNSSNSNLATVSPTPSNAAQVNVAGTADGSTPITFTPSAVSYAAGDPVWLAVTSSGPYVTPVTLYFQIGAQAGQLQPGLHTATMTLTAGGITAAVITVTYYANAANSGSGTVIPSSTSVPLSAAFGSSTSTTITLTTTSATSISFSTPATPSSGNSTWLTATANIYAVSSATYAVLTIGASAVGLGSGTYYGTVTISPTGGGTASQISITFTVGTGGGTGNLNANPGSISWTYTTVSGVYPTAQVVTLTSASGASTYTASVSGSSGWLNANGTSSTSGFISSGITVSPGATFSSMTTGSYTGYVYVQDGNGNQATITVYLTVNGGSGNGITLSPNPVTLSAAVNGATVAQAVSVSYPTSGSITGTSTNGSGLTWYVTTSNLPGSISVYGNPTGLGAGTYNGSLTVTVTPTGGTAVSTTITVSFVVGSGGTTTTPGTVTPTSLTFAYQTGAAVNSTTLPGQNIVITGSGTYSVSAPTYGSGQPGGWLTTSPSGTYAPGTITVSVAPGALAASATPYTATLTVTTASGTANVSVNFLVASSPVLVAYPGTLSMSYQAGGGIPSLSLYLNASDYSAIPVTASTSTTWLSVTAPTQPNTSTLVTVSGNNVASLANGVYTGSVTVTASGAANSPVNIPVVLTVTGSTATGGGNLTLSASSMTFNAIQNGSAPASQNLLVSASSLAYYTATATSNGNWLSVSPSGSLNTSSNPSLAVSVNQSGLTANTYYGAITLVANGFTQTVQVTMVVSASSTGGGGNVTVTGNGLTGTPSLTFTYQVGGSTPTVQTLQVVSASGSSAVSFTITSSATWLSAGVQNGTSLNTPVGFTVAIVNPSSLAAGAYNATITITPNGGTAVTIPVSLTVQAAPTISVTSATIVSFSYQSGNANPTPATVTVSGGGQSLGFTAQVTSGSNWLSVSPASGTTPTTGTATVTATATPGTLGAGTYNGTILISGSGPTTGSTSINVILTVTAPLPTINSVVNAASFINGMVSPGEIVTLFGTAMGPAAAAYATIDPSTGKLATTIGGVQVLFSGTPAPMIYASATQISAVVPYEMARVASPQVWIRYVGQTSNAYQLASATTMPGVFTQNASGSGPGAILNQNNSLNGPGNPAAKGSIVQLFMTGEGQTSPQGVTGAITTATLQPPQVTPAPLLPVAVLINGQPALWTYAGEAPGLAAGLMQLNVQIPPSAQSGVPNSIVVSIGPNMSQTGVTVSVQ
jgi:uncharacterized protein (TIGR03437 family)